MYSVVLAAMLTAGGETPNWCHGCHGCHGCTGYVGSCHGCWGCHGGWGCHGCHGCWGCSGCSGCSGCWGAYGFSGAGAVAYAPAAASYYPSWGYYGYYGGCFGCWGGCYGGVAVVAAVPAGSYPTTVAAVPVTAVPVASTVPAVVPVAQTRQPEAVASAQVTVRLPAEARLWVDGTPCPLTSDTRSFATPRLEPGREYVYTMRAEAIRDGQTVTQTQRVVLAAGRQVNVTFGDLAPASVTRR